MELVHEYNKDKDKAEGVGVVFSMAVTDKESGRLKGGVDLEGFSLNITAAVLTIFEEHEWLQEALEHLKNHSKYVKSKDATKDTNTKLN